MLFLFLVTVALPFLAAAQPITGVWKGKINNKRVEVKFVQKGDSITGTSYYPGLIKNYKRFSIKGYFDGSSNSIVWWDEQQIHPPVQYNPNAREFFWADYNCPGGNRMFLTSDPRNKENSTVGLTKVERTSFPDEWDFIIDNYQFGANDPYLIDSIALVAFNPPPVILPEPKKAESESPKPAPQPVLASVHKKDNEKAKPVENKPAPVQPKQPPLVFLDRKEVEQKTKPIEKKVAEPIPAAAKPELIKQPETQPIVTIAPPTPPAPVAKREPLVKKEELILPPTPPTNEDKFKERKKIFALEIPVSGDSIELRFYDNAEVDGDSISLFLNDKLIFEHIRLTSYAFTIKLPVKEMNQENELVMLAENLGSIPPNTAYMVVMVGDKRHEAQITSTEETSALIRLRKE